MLVHVDGLGEAWLAREVLSTHPKGISAIAAWVALELFRFPSYQPLCSVDTLILPQPLAVMQLCDRCQVVRPKVAFTLGVPTTCQLCTIVPASTAWEGSAEALGARKGSADALGAREGSGGPCGDAHGKAVMGEVWQESVCDSVWVHC